MMNAHRPFILSVARFCAAQYECLPGFLRTKPAESKYIFVFALLIAGCGDRVTGTYESEVEEQQKYFPLAIGQVTEYRVDSVAYNEVPGVGLVQDSSTTYLREVVTDTLRDNLGNVQWKVEQYERRSENDNWVIARIWTAERTEAQAVRTEENLRFLRLIFPMNRRSEWDGNIWIGDEQTVTVAGQTIRPFVNWNYEVDSIDIPRAIGSFNFEQVLVVTEVDETNIIEKRFSRSVYAKNVGLVFREQWIADSQYCNKIPVPADCATKPWEEKAERGYYLRQTILSF